MYNIENLLNFRLCFYNLISKDSLNYERQFEQNKSNIDYSIRNTEEYKKVKAAYREIIDTIPLNEMNDILKDTGYYTDLLKNDDDLIALEQQIKEEREINLLRKEKLSEAAHKKRNIY